ncbi:MAG: hypothetical protein WAX89_01210 [Alphaproteobacteria bacterium]
MTDQPAWPASWNFLPDEVVRTFGYEPEFKDIQAARLLRSVYRSLWDSDNYSKLTLPVTPPHTPRHEVYAEYHDAVNVLTPAQQEAVYYLLQTGALVPAKQYEAIDQERVWDLRPTDDVLWLLMADGTLQLLSEGAYLSGGKCTLWPPFMPDQTCPAVLKVRKRLEYGYALVEPEPITILGEWHAQVVAFTRLEVARHAVRHPALQAWPPHLLKARQLQS